MFSRILALLLLFTGPLKSSLVFESSRAATTLLARSGQRLIVPGACCCCSEEAAHRFESFVGHRRASCQGLSGEARRSEGHTSELQSLMRISYAVFCLKKKNKKE